MKKSVKNSLVLATAAGVLTISAPLATVSAANIDTYAAHEQASLALKASWWFAGNAAQYGVAATPHSQYYQLLQGKRVAFLGSSITDGLGALGEGTPDYLRQADGMDIQKYAISGTTMAGHYPWSFVNRLQTDIPKDQHLDALVVQLSTNDKRFHIPAGQISDSKNLADFNTGTTTGAMEYIIKYAQDTWHAPVVFYTVLDPKEAGYQAQIDTLYALQKKWGIQIINLGQDPHIQAETAANPQYMADDVHPTREGYQTLWLPYFESKLSELFDTGRISN
ncbi:SGNH/GDSL hydrolase family protein [Lactobacillaceae bacterium L1_55_11]|nr:SGNH/GDSL hydrolase family protein [Lactobacillaceae bacterium L1_55_11]